jgi:hypothetical protein
MCWCLRLVLGPLGARTRLGQQARSAALTAEAEGPPKKNRRTPPVHLLNLRPTHPPSELFFLDFFLARFWAFLGKGSSKTPYKYFCKKSMSKTFPKISTKISMSVFPRLFWFHRVFGCFSAMGVQKHYKKRFAKKIVSKSFYKKFDNFVLFNKKTRFFIDFFLTFLGVSR